MKKIKQILFEHETEEVERIEPGRQTQPKGFIDFETGKRVDIDLKTQKEVEVI